jgi:hypothetical protein
MFQQSSWLMLSLMLMLHAMVARDRTCSGTPTVGVVIAEVVMVHVHEGVAGRSPTGACVMDVITFYSPGEVHPWPQGTLPHEAMHQLHVHVYTRKCFHSTITLNSM